MDNATQLGTVAQVLGLKLTRQLTLPGAPWSKMRPKFTHRGHAYQDPRDRAAEEVAAMRLRSAIKRPFTGNVGLVCTFYRPDRRRLDVDNMLKWVLDSANGVLWADDSQCTLLLGMVEYDRTNPRTVIVVGEHASSLERRAPVRFRSTG